MMLVGAGCMPAKEVVVAPTPETKPAAPAPQPKIEPLTLTYTLKNFFGPNSESGVTFWLEEARKCDGRDAYLGLMKMQAGPGSNQDVYAKVTIYADNGELASTRFVQPDELVFDDMIPQYNDLSIPLTVNFFFAAGGKNFNEDANWNASAPILLKQVDTGKQVADYSVVRQAGDDDTSGIAPCRKFKIVEKSTNGSSTYAVCLSKDVGKFKLPFVVSMAFAGDGGMPSWALKSFSSDKSGVDWVPQCLKPVKCVAPKQFTDVEQRTCNSKGSQIEPVVDDNGCFTEYKCMSQEDLAERSINNMQRPGCGVNPAVKQKVVQCRKQNMPNFDTTQYDNGGCMLDIVCRP